MDAPPFYFVSKWVRHAFAFFSLLDGDAERGRTFIVSNNFKTNLFTMTNDELQFEDDWPFALSLDRGGGIDTLLL